MIAPGRKNWLFCWIEAGVRQTGMIQSLLATCRMQAANPWVWLVDVLQRVATHPQRDVALLTPRLWKERFADAPMTSDVGTGDLRDALRQATGPFRHASRSRVRQTPAANTRRHSRYATLRRCRVRADRMDGVRDRATGVRT